MSRPVNQILDTIKQIDGYLESWQNQRKQYMVELEEALKNKDGIRWFRPNYAEVFPGGYTFGIDAEGTTWIKRDGKVELAASQGKFWPSSIAGFLKKNSWVEL